MPASPGEARGGDYALVPLDVVDRIVQHLAPQPWQDVDAILSRLRGVMTCTAEELAPILAPVPPTEEAKGEAGGSRRKR